MKLALIRSAALTAALLLVPLVAMQFTEEVNWDAVDFLAGGLLLFGAGLAYELLAWKVDGVALRAGIGVATGAVVLLVWANLAVGLW